MRVGSLLLKTAGTAFSLFLGVGAVHAASGSMNGVRDGSTANNSGTWAMQGDYRELDTCRTPYPCGYQRDDVEIPLLSKCLAPIYLLCGAVLFFVGVGISNYGLTTHTTSEPVADAIWLCGWLIGAVGSAGIILALLCLII